MIDYYEAVGVEVFKDIPGWPAYQVSNLGSVRSAWKRRGPEHKFHIIKDGDWKYMSPNPGKHGHMCIILYGGDGTRRNAMVHALVLEAFTGPPRPDQEVLHWDGNPRNNRFDNLRWGTHSENEMDKVRHGTHRKGSRHPLAKLSEPQIIKVRNLKFSGRTQKDVASEYGVSRQLVGLIWRGIGWEHVECPDHTLENFNEPVRPPKRRGRPPDWARKGCV